MNTVNTATPHVTIETVTTIKDIKLDGKSLKFSCFTSTYEVVRDNNKFLISKKEIEELVQPMEFPLVELSSAELAVYRWNNIPSFVLKKDGKLFHCIVPYEINFISCETLGKHLCSRCNRLSAATDDQGGCAKVRAFSQRIERYPWIKLGYETFSTKLECFAVIECEHCEDYPPRKKHIPTTGTRRSNKK